MAKRSGVIGLSIGALLTSVLAVPAQGASSRASLKRILSGYSRPVLVTHSPGNTRVIFIVLQGHLSPKAESAGRRNREVLDQELGQTIKHCLSRSLLTKKAH